MKKRTRAAAIILHEDKVLLMHRNRKGFDYYVFPGGGVEEGETVEEAVVREVEEETCLKIRLDRCLYYHDYNDESDQYYYLCEYISGTPKLGEANEKESMRRNGKNVYEPLWVETSKLKKLLVYPLEIRDWLMLDLEEGFKQAPKKATPGVEELRQALSRSKRL